MLSLSADKTASKIDLQMVNGHAGAAQSSQLQWARELMEFATAIASRDELELSRTRDALLTVAGADVVVDAACVAANFQRMVRIADSTGIPVDAQRQPMMDAAAEALQLRRFESSKNTPPLGRFKKLLGPLQRKLGPIIMRRVASKQ